MRSRIASPTPCSASGYSMAMKTMRAARLHHLGEPMVIERIAVPDVRPTDVRVKVAPTPYSRDVRESYHQGWRTGTGRS